MNMEEPMPQEIMDNLELDRVKGEVALCTASISLKPFFLSSVL